MSTVYQKFRETTNLAGDKPFLHIPAEAATHYANGDLNFTYNETLERIDQLAEGYSAGGYSGKTRVALALENRPEFFFHWFALNSLGCSVVPVSAEMQLEELAYFLQHAGVPLVVAVPEAVDAMKAASAATEQSPTVISITDLAELPACSYDDARADPDGSTECALLYTSGSTGKPKGCILNNDYFLAFGDWYRDLGGIASIRWGEERLLTPLPLGHMNAMAVSTLGMIANAGCIIQLDRFHPRSWWQSVRDSNATMLHYLGVLPAILLQLPPGDDDFGGQIRFGFGAGVNPQHHAAFEQRFGFPLVESWAMTECGAGGCITANTEPRHVGTCCFGRPLPAVEYQLVNEDKQPVALGEDGELRVRASGPDPKRGFFSGYLSNPEATEEAWQDGWLNTGDVARQGEDGSLYFVDRRKNVIRRSGENISALEVETALSLYPAIDEVLVTAVEDELRGDEVAACVVASVGNAADENLAHQIVNHCLHQLVYFKAPGYIIFCDELPKTASNKPRRADLKKLVRERVQKGSCWDTRHMKKRSNYQQDPHVASP